MFWQVTGLIWRRRRSWADWAALGLLGSSWVPPAHSLPCLAQKLGVKLSRITERLLIWFLIRFMYVLPWKAAVSLSPVPLGGSLPTGAEQGELPALLGLQGAASPAPDRPFGVGLSHSGAGIHTSTWEVQGSNPAVLSILCSREGMEQCVRKEPPAIPCGAAAGSGMLWCSWSGALSQEE